MSFLAKALERNGELYRIVTGTNQGKPCWYILKMDAAKRDAYLAAVKQESIDLSCYGTVVERGWGEAPPEEIIQKYQKS